MNGPGKYDAALTTALLTCEASQGILIVLDGAKGSGFSCQATLASAATLPQVLRHLADEIEKEQR